MQEELRGYGAKLQADDRAPIEVRVGVNTGDSVVRSISTGGQGQSIAVVAEPGTGKSRLFHEFKATLPGECKLLEAYSVSHGKSYPISRCWRCSVDISVSKKATTKPNGARRFRAGSMRST